MEGRVSAQRGSDCRWRRKLHGGRAQPGAETTRPAMSVGLSEGLSISGTQVACLPVPCSLV